MSNKYNSIRSRNLFKPTDEKPYKISRSKIEDFLKCPRCFYLDRKCGTSHPPSFPFTLNNAVDSLLKKEFDNYRKQRKSHPLCVENAIDAVPFSHPDLEDWRMNQKGIQYLHKPTQFIITGAIDDVWINSREELIIVDYKATSSTNEITLEEGYRQSYKRQMEIYQWLFRKNGFKVSKTGYFVYCNADTEKNDFKKKLEFKMIILPYEGNDFWIENALLEIRVHLNNDSIPEPLATCDYCQYWLAIKKHTDRIAIQ